MEDDKFKLELFSDQGFSRLVELTNTTYSGREIADQQYLGWEYIDNPDGLAVISSASIEAKIVSQYIVIPRQYSISNKIIAGSLSVNSLTHPEFKGLGFFPKLASLTFDRCKERNIYFTIGFPNNISLPVIERKRIFKVAGYLSLLVLPLNPVSAVLKYLKSRKNKTGSELDLDISASDLNTETGISLFNFKDDQEEYTEFIKKFNLQKSNLTNRTLPFLRWRYVNIPWRTYKIIKVKSAGKITGIAIYRARFMFGLKVLILIDFITLEPETTVPFLLKFTKSMAKLNKMDLILTALPAHTEEFRVVRKNGYLFIPDAILPQKIAFIVKQHNDLCPPGVGDFKKWYLTFGDYDIF